MQRIAAQGTRKIRFQDQMRNTHFEDRELPRSLHLFIFSLNVNTRWVLRFMSDITLAGADISLTLAISGDTKRRPLHAVVTPLPIQARTRCT